MCMFVETLARMSYGTFCGENTNLLKNYFKRKLNTKQPLIKTYRLFQTVQHREPQRWRKGGKRGGPDFRPQAAPASPCPTGLWPLLPFSTVSKLFVINESFVLVKNVFLPVLFFIVFAVFETSLSVFKYVRNNSLTANYTHIIKYLINKKWMVLIKK